MWGKEFCLRKQHDGRDWALNHQPSDLKSNALTTTQIKNRVLSVELTKILSSMQEVWIHLFRLAAFTVELSRRMTKFSSVSTENRQSKSFHVKYLHKNTLV